MVRRWCSQLGMAGALLLQVLLSPASFAQTIHIIASTDNPKGSLHVLALEKFSELLNHTSSGELQLRVHYRGNSNLPAMGGEEANMNMVMGGFVSDKGIPLHVTVIAAGNASLKARALEFLMLPYIFPDMNSAQRLFRSELMRKELNEIIATKHNVRALGWLIGGFRHLTNSRRHITRLEHIRGLIIRTPRSRIMRDTYKSFGATPKPINWADTFEALKSNQVDGQENPYSVIVDSKFWEAGQRFVTNNGPFLWVGPILIHEPFYQSLSKRNRALLERAASEAAEYQWRWIVEQNDQFKKILLERGMSIDELEDKERWIEASRPLWKQYYPYIGYGDPKKGKALINQVLQITRQSAP
ncbi:TRAP transporter substrate-binding protein [Dongshaea marina]|uniref:TRAP transporter substrate-binding protein n=1 Tax=Dongshaea marina TaxID=2047966 RepID=UPI00131ED268|nr:TRAP transporter substrate-binding protein [Dongshaea marina]